MSTQNFDYLSEKGEAPIRAWVKGVPVEQEALAQVHNAAKLPFVTQIALMPDVHHGIGCTVGAVIATEKAIIPAAVGVDIGCGMMAVKTTLTASDLPDNLEGIRGAIEQAVPHGRTDNGGPNDKGSYQDPAKNAVAAWMDNLGSRWRRLINTHHDLDMPRHPAKHLGTLGTGNHFIEMCLDQDNAVWLMLHTGSRGVGNRIGSYFIEKAKEEMRRWHVDKYLPDQDLAYLPEHTELYKDYVDAVDWAQTYAAINRAVMMENVIAAVRTVIEKPFTTHEVAVNCHHNYVTKENHGGKNVWVTRKGAVRAREGDLGIIPGSMGAKSFIVRGKGNPESLCSCSHGAGRKMSRTQAKKLYSVEDHVKATEGVECRKDADVIDETPMAYKDIDAVMAAQTDLVDVVYTLKQVVCVKG